MDIKDIREKIQEAVESRGCFITDVAVSSDNDIEIAIESENGTVEMDDCVAIDKAFHELFNQDVEDYALTVTSAGLDQPFKVLKQFQKAIGTMVEAKIKGGKKLVAELVAADEESVTLKYSVKEAVEGSKKKALVEHVDKFAMDQVNSVTPYITFE